MVIILKEHSILLNTEWYFSYLPHHEYIKSYADLDLSTIEEIEKSFPLHYPASVPGNFELDLEQNGIIDFDPFYAENIYRLHQYENMHAWYYCSFTAECEQHQLQHLMFEGLDTYATVYLNGKMILETDNMLIPYNVDVTSKLQKKNELVIHFRPACIEARKYHYTAMDTGAFYNTESLAVRKAPHMYGWDIMPRVVSLGIWRNVFLVYKPETYFEECFLDCTGISEENHSATARFFYKIHTNQDLLQHAEVRISGNCEDGFFSEKRIITFVAGAIYFEIPNAYLWWPKNYGKPSRYCVKAEFILNGQTVCEAEWKSGLRIVEIDRSSSDGNNQGFCIKVNHTPIFVLGTNWVPLDVFHSRDPQRLGQALELLDEIQCNMVRCWGGNVYESQEFFDFCDEKGIMVWQDFAMACGFYPQDDDFYNRIRQEAEIIVKRLRQHPSLAIWCGDNECDLFAAICYGYSTLDPNSNQITGRILREVLAKNAPSLPYLPSSPYIVQKGLQHYAEDHLWGPRNYFKSYYYDQSTCCFASEIGYHGCPSAKSVKKFIDTEHLWPYQDNTQWFCHATAPVADPEGDFNCRIYLMADQVQEFFGIVPQNLEHFSLLSQIVQAEAMKHFIENFRAAKWEKTGLIWWNLVDGWPQFSDAIIDYFFEKKLAFDFIKRAQQPICIVAKETEGWNRQFVICNDTVQKISCDYQIIDLVTDKIVNFGHVSLEKGENRHIWETRCFSTAKTIYIMKWTIDGKQYMNHYLSGYPTFDPDWYIELMKKAEIL